MSVQSEKALILSELDVDDLAYRGEGNLSLVVSLKSVIFYRKFRSHFSVKAIDRRKIPKNFCKLIETSFKAKKGDQDSET